MNGNSRVWKWLGFYCTAAIMMGLAYVLRGQRTLTESQVLFYGLTLGVLFLVSMLILITIVRHSPPPGEPRGRLDSRSTEEALTSIAEEALARSQQRGAGKR